MFKHYDAHLGNMVRTKPTYDTFLYNLPEGKSAALYGDDSVLDGGRHPIKSVVYNFNTETFSFYSTDDSRVYVCTVDDDELNILIRFAVE